MCEKERESVKFREAVVKINSRDLVNWLDANLTSGQKRRLIEGR